MPGYSADQKKKGLHRLLKNAAHSHVPLTDGCASLLFMQLINIFSRISTILQPTSNTAIYHFVKEDSLENVHSVLFRLIKKCSS